MKEQAKSSTLLFLKRNVPTDERTVNRLFVSAFIDSNWMEPPQSAFLSRYCIGKGDTDYKVFQKVREHIRGEYGSKISLEVLVKLFEFVISPADRIVTGAVYTPKDVRRTILQRTLGDKNEDELRNIRIADISCGCGGFVMDAAQWIHHKTGKQYSEIYRENIYGIDIQEYAIERTKILLSLLALSEGEDEDFKFNLLCKDTLDFACEGWDVKYTGFDVVVGNPPYVCSRNLPEETHVKLRAYEVCSSGHPDLYIPFFQIAIELLNNGGRLGFITMNTFLRSVNGRAIRNYFSRNRYSINIVDFRGYQVFDSKNTYTCLFYLDKHHTAENIHYAVSEQGDLSDNVHYTAVPFAALDDEKGWTLNNFDETTAIEAVGIQIKDYCPSRHGIATLSNDIYIFKPVSADERYYILERDGIKYPIERGICRDIINPNRLNSIDDLYTLYEKVIYPYHIENGRAIVYTPGEMRNIFPRAYAYLRAKRSILVGRDKGDINDYPQWYAYGRTQSLVMPRYKLFFPKFANKSLRCAICDAPDLMFYNGLAFVSTDDRKLLILKAIIESKFFWKYIQTNGKPYSSGYYSLSGVDIKHFGIPDFSPEEEDELLGITDKSEIERWLRRKYGLAGKGEF
jgi:methylase of polypeptide subunit release factors